MGLKTLCKLIPVVAMILQVTMWASEATAGTTNNRVMLMVERHEKWMFDFNRTYQDEEEKEARRKIFTKNAEYIESFNQASGAIKTYKLAHNKFSDMTKEEFLESLAGYINGGSRLEVPTSFQYTEDAINSVPHSVDWRKKGAVTPVKSQGQCGACWAFSAVAAIEGLIQIKTGRLTSLSEQQLIDCDRNIDMNNGCVSGSMEPAFDYIVSKRGLMNESDYPYVGFGVNRTCKEVNSSRVAKIDGFKMVAVNNETELMKAVTIQPVAVGIDAHPFQFYSSGVVNEKCGFDGNYNVTLNHAVAVVGFDKDINGSKYWIVKNSWGSGWGEDGYMKLQKDIGDSRGTCGIAMEASYPIITA